MSTPPGWYPDPEWMGRERYWDGRSWTSHSRRYQSRARHRGSPGAAPPEAARPPGHEDSPPADRAVPAPRSFADGPSPHTLPDRLTPPEHEFPERTAPRTPDTDQN